jgi:hypothetical protein
VDVVRTGIYVSILEHKKETEKIKDVKDQVYKNKKLNGLRLIEMVEVGILRPVLDYLKNLKEKHNYSDEDISSEFESLLSNWKKITIFVKNEDKEEVIFNQAIKLIDNKEETFFIFAKGKAIETAQSVIVKLHNGKHLLEKDYVWFAEINNETIPPTYYCGIHSSDFLI